MAILKCNNKACVNEFQDKTYGVGMRVQNPDSKGSHSCTACGASTGGSTGKKKK